MGHLVRPLVLRSALNQHGIYEAYSADGKSCFTMDPKTKEVVLSWNGEEAGGFDLAAVAFFRGYTEFVMPIADKDDTLITKDEWRFINDMNVAHEYCQKLLQPPGVVVH